MSIRRILMIAFLLFSVITAALVSTLTYYRARGALHNEIRLSVQAQALNVTEQIESVIFERVENLFGWSRLDVMQDLKIEDVDKRLATFLRDIKLSYAGIYQNLLCVRDGRVVAASDAGLINQRWPVEPAWMRIPMQNAEVAVARPRPDAEVPVLTLSTTVSDHFSQYRLGEIHARFAWKEIYNLLDHAVAHSERYAVLLDQEHHFLAASAGLRKHPDLMTVNFASWVTGDGRYGVSTIDGQPLGLSKLLVGFARTTGYKGLPALGWTLLIITPQRIALAPIAQMLHTLIALFLFTALLAIVLAIYLSGQIATPIQRLTAATSKFDIERDPAPSAIGGGREVGELSAAFTRLVEGLKQSRHDLIRVSKLAAVGEMAAVLAHEVRNPLGILRSSTELLKRQLAPNARSHEMLDFMLSECDRINGLVSDLLNSARPRMSSFEYADLDVIVRQLIESLQSKGREKNVVIEFIASAESQFLDCDRNQLIQLTLNLAINAIQMTPAGGQVVVRSWGTDSAVYLEVADSGPGIAMSERSHVLDPFVSQRPGGIGLGLTVVQDIVRRHRGELTIGDSTLGGASFISRFPRRRSEFIE
ncbi:MAG: HAMP domain-containing histidine kinase [Gammaproteobacteria bacterium]|nr:HAMP domain-containing histidine kinase [Gammaproteobacteria bacterium]